jgi:hypothetical protein
VPLIKVKVYLPKKRTFAALRERKDIINKPSGLRSGGGVNVK